MNHKLSNVASAEQKGRAAELRTRIYDKDLYYELNQIVHSGDTRKSRYGKLKNKFRDLSNKYSGDVEKVLREAEKKRNELTFKKTIGRGLKK